MKSVKIEVPQGYEIDKEKSTFENIVFKEVKNKLPETWEELGKIKGYWIDYDSIISDNNNYVAVDASKNVFATKEQAEASIALAQLSQLREVYRNGWVPDWGNSESKYCIENWKDKITIDIYCGSSRFLSFQDAETRDLFLENFKDLIEQAKPLLS